MAFPTDDGLVPSDANGAQDVYLHDRTTTAGTAKADGSPVRVDSTPDDVHLVESPDGRYRVFHGSDCTLVPRDSNPCGTFGGQDVFVQDMQTGISVLASRNTDGTQASAPSWSGPRT